jgi:novobiocin biosynthesis protein NovU/D-mycarose 3-C-methyltransferase
MKKEIINLGNLPLVNNLFKSESDSINTKRYGLKVIEEDNLLMKLDVEIPSQDMFETYLYRSSINKPYAYHCIKMWSYIDNFSPKRIADIGGNDGTLLSAFKQMSNNQLDLVNIDASSSFKDDNENKGITYIQQYWGDLIFDKKFDVITSTNVFQHNPNYRKFLNGIRNNLNGIWILEFPYFLETVKTNQFDQIYHEHVFYWLLTPLYPLLKEYGLKIIDLSIQDIHGGSMRIVSSNRPEHKENTDQINLFLEEESKFNFDKWGDKISKKLKIDRIFLDNLKGSTAAFGAAAKGCVYLNCVKPSTIKYIIDDTPDKQNMFSPGTGLKILDRSILKIDPPDNIVILAHNFKHYIAESLRSNGYTGKIFAMLPEIEEL